MSELVDLVNRFRAQGWSYDKIKEKLIKMGNSRDVANSAVDEYIRRILE